MKIMRSVVLNVEHGFSCGDIHLGWHFNYITAHLSQHNMVHHQGQLIGMWEFIGEGKIRVRPLPSHRQKRVK